MLVNTLTWVAKIGKETFASFGSPVLTPPLKPYNLKYNQFIALLEKNKIDLNRKILANLALEDPQTFAVIVKKITSKQQNVKQAKN
ncbi:MAG: 50S ribosomal protein L20 [Patescibacteria group bacterium]